MEGQIGLEQTPDEYVSELVGIFRDIKRVLRHDGTLWLNIGDSYATSPPGNKPNTTALSSGLPNSIENQEMRREAQARVNKSKIGYKPKDLIGIPWMVAFALRADGWYLRSDIIWAKPSHMPESVTDRPTKSHEYVFLLTLSERYYYDAEAIKELITTDPHNPGNKETGRLNGDNCVDQSDRIWGTDGTRNKRSVWTVNLQPFPEAHFATFPPALIEPMIKAGTSAHGVCLDCGAPWRRVVSRGGEPDLEQQIACGGDANGKYHGAAIKDYGAAGAQDASAVKARILDNIRQKTTLGWYPTCACYKAPPLPTYPKRPAYKAGSEEQHAWRSDCRSLDSIAAAICQELMSEHAVAPAVVFDPFAGVFTTALVADRLKRNSIAIELNPEYVEIGKRRLMDDAPLFSQIAETFDPEAAQLPLL